MFLFNGTVAVVHKWSAFRYEFQHRGSPHIHALVWVKGTPEVDVDSDDAVTAYVDLFMTCDSDVARMSLSHNFLHAFLCINCLIAWSKQEKLASK